MFVWQNITTMTSRSYTCGYCGNSLASEKGFLAQLGPTGPVVAYIYVCHHCWQPTFFDPVHRQTPGVTYGGQVKDIPEKALNDLYEEARKTTGAGAYTAAVLCCRKLLMHIAVSKGAKAGDTFINYVQYLADNNFIPPDAKTWVDHIRTKGNEANHEIAIMGQADAEELLAFCEMLLKVIYEFPAAVRKKTVKP